VDTSLFGAGGVSIPRTAREDRTLKTISPVQLLKEWDLEANRTPPEESTLPHRFEIQSLRLLARGRPVTPEMIASELGIPAQLARSVFEASHGKGQWDEQGHLIGSALSLLPTQHRFRVKSANLYTWCAHDTILLPGLLGMVAEVVSPDPVNGNAINVVIGPDGPKTCSPASAVLTTYDASEPATGPASPVCMNSHYFTSNASADAWSKDRSRVRVTTVEDAFAQVRQNLLDPLRPILDELNHAT
jgi:alkylmercury lyase